MQFRKEAGETNLGSGLTTSQGVPSRQANFNDPDVVFSGFGLNGAFGQDTTQAEKGDQDKKSYFQKWTDLSSRSKYMPEISGFTPGVEEVA